MPTYQYACTASTCGHRFEAVQSFSDASLTTCPVCSGVLRKVYSPVGVVFKGSGFYRTDSRNSGAKKSSEPAGSKENSSSSTAESKSDSGTSSSSTSTSAEKSSSSTAGSSSSSGSKDKAAAS